MWKNSEAIGARGLRVESGGGRGSMCSTDRQILPTVSLKTSSGLDSSQWPLEEWAWNRERNEFNLSLLESISVQYKVPIYEKFLNVLKIDPQIFAKLYVTYTISSILQKLHQCCNHLLCGRLTCLSAQTMWARRLSREQWCFMTLFLLLFRHIQVLIPHSLKYIL